MVVLSAQVRHFYGRAIDQGTLLQVICIVVLIGTLHSKGVKLVRTLSLESFFHPLSSKSIPTWWPPC